MRQQASDVGLLGRGQAGHHIAQVRVGVVAVEARRLNQAHDGRSALARAQWTGKQPVLAAQRNRAHLVLSPVVVDGPVTVVNRARQWTFPVLTDSLKTLYGVWVSGDCVRVCLSCSCFLSRLTDDMWPRAECRLRELYQASI